MELAITTKGRITIPKAIREHLGLKSGDRVKFFIHPDGSVVLLPKRSVKPSRPRPARSRRPPSTQRARPHPAARGCRQGYLTTSRCPAASATRHLAAYPPRANQMTSATATMARMMATNARAFHAGPRSTPEYACPLRGVDPVLPGPRSVMGRSYSARLALSVVWGADEAVVFATSVTILLTP